jgi:hypothetical protein
MEKEKRKSRRRQVRYAAWVALAPGDLHDCALSDISNTGARIDVRDADKLPNAFELWLASNGSARRDCRVVWRKPTQIGVRFEGRQPANETGQRRNARR